MYYYCCFCRYYYGIESVLCIIPIHRGVVSNMIPPLLLRLLHVILINRRMEPMITPNSFM